MPAGKKGCGGQAGTPVGVEPGGHEPFFVVNRENAPAVYLGQYAGQSLRLRSVPIAPLPASSNSPPPP